MRPVLMTTVSTIFGMLPVAFGTGDGSEWRAPMGIISIGGLADVDVPDPARRAGRLHAVRRRGARAPLAGRARARGDPSGIEPCRCRRS